MLCFYSSKGGVGCSTTAAATALLLARRRPTLLVDLAGDQADILGLPPARTTAADPVGLGQWLAGDQPSPDALQRLEIPVTQSLALLAWGSSAADASPDRVSLLATMLSADTRSVVVDVGHRRHFDHFLARAGRSVLVTRSCYVALTRARDRPTPDDIVLIDEAHRALTAADVAAVIDAPITATLVYEPRVFRAVDAGILIDRMPRSLRGLEVFA